MPQKKRAMTTIWVHAGGMREVIDTRQPALVEEAVKADYARMFPQGNPEFITQIFGWFQSWFDGRYKDFQPIDARLS